MYPPSDELHYQDLAIIFTHWITINNKLLASCLHSICKGGHFSPVNIVLGGHPRGTIFTSEYCPPGHFVGGQYSLQHRSSTLLRAPPALLNIYCIALAIASRTRRAIGRAFPSLDFSLPQIEETGQGGH